MKNEDISQETLRAYVLGRLDEQTTESLDELSVTSQEVADRISGEQYELIDGWIGGTLSDDERSAMSAAVARSPALRKRAEISRAMMTAARPAAVVERIPSDSWFAKLFGHRPALAYGFASILFAATVFTALFVYFRPGQQASEVAVVPPVVVDDPTAATSEPSVDRPEVTSPTNTYSTPGNTDSPSEERPRDANLEKRAIRNPTFATLILSPPTRSSSGVRSVRLSADVDYLRLEVNTEADFTGKLRVVISDASGGRTAWTSAALVSRNRDNVRTVMVNVPASRLKAGSYSLKLVEAGRESNILDEHILRIDR